MKILDVKVYLKSGNTIEFATRNLEKEFGYIGLTKLTWENLDNETNLFHLNLDQVEAITCTERWEGGRDDIRRNKNDTDTL